MDLSLFLPQPSRLARVSVRPQLLLCEHLRQFLPETVNTPALVGILTVPSSMPLKVWNEPVPLVVQGAAADRSVLDQNGGSILSLDRSPGVVKRVLNSQRGSAARFHQCRVRSGSAHERQRVRGVVGVDRPLIGQCQAAVADIAPALDRFLVGERCGIASRTNE
jgi:hypothetical protein